MKNILNDLTEVANTATQLLKANAEWEERYAKYAQKLLANQESIKVKKKLFNQFSPLFLYMNVTNATGNGMFGLRYCGQQVADLFVSKSDEVKISTKKFDKTNCRDFGCQVSLANQLWNSQLAQQFRKHFKNHYSSSRKQGKENIKSNEEHRIESLLLSEFSKTNSAEKWLCGIQPVKLFGGISRFQMPTPLSASGKSQKYSGTSGGGIDILCRVGTGANTKLCVIEVKDETLASEPPNKAIAQAIAYAVFVRELLRSKSGSHWYKIFGFCRTIPKNLQIVVSVAMPLHKTIGSNFENIEIALGDSDKLILQSIYFTEEGGSFTNFTSSFLLRANSCK